VYPDTLIKIPGAPIVLPGALIVLPGALTVLPCAFIVLPGALIVSVEIPMVLPGACMKDIKCVGGTSKHTWLAKKQSHEAVTQHWAAPVHLAFICALQVLQYF